MQAQLMSVMAMSEGTSMVTETIFENRFMHVSELARLGADITIKGQYRRRSRTAQVIGRSDYGDRFTCKREVSSLAGSCAEGETIVNRIYHLDRGYEKMEEKLAALGADIERIS
ncbi:unnamed protein product [Sphagnum jensenii]|uniref:UDP-N-acetylglucosamine 1-carboxyvinyltransferase n=1 Tax=Sphagnum jensenii TaxID=128206 RepID=A0ABP0VBP5_9BRYO